MTGFDVLLRWLSESVEGAYDSFAAAHGWLMSDGSAEAAAWMTAEDLSDLGHIDLDWAARRWSASPPVLNYLPPNSQLSVLCGARPDALVERLRSVDSIGDGPDVEVEPYPQAGGPTVWLSAGSRSETARLAERLGVRFIEDAADAIAEHLPPIGNRLGRPTTVTGGWRQLSRFDADIMDFTWASRMDDPGLYRVAGVAGTTFLFHPGGGLYHDVARGVGMYAELGRRSKSVIYYHGGSFWVPAIARPPSAQRRCLVLCSGFLPGEDGDFLRYRDVPWNIAHRVALSLRQAPIDAFPSSGWRGRQRP